MLDNNSLADWTKEIREEVISHLVDRYIPPESMQEEWDIHALTQTLRDEFSLDAHIDEWLKADSYLSEKDIKKRILDQVEEQYTEKKAVVGEETMTRFEREVMLSVLDQHWREHLSVMDYLRQGIGLRGYGQKNPKQEYKREAFELFEHLLDTVKWDVAKYLIAVNISPQKPEQSQYQVETIIEQKTKMQQELLKSLHRPEPQAIQESGPLTDNDPLMMLLAAAQRGDIHIGRNDTCPCGSKRRFKDCHGKLV